MIQHSVGPTRYTPARICCKTGLPVYTSAGEHCPEHYWHNNKRHRALSSLPWGASPVRNSQSKQSNCASHWYCAPFPQRKQDLKWREILGITPSSREKKIGLSDESFIYPALNELYYAHICEHTTAHSICLPTLIHFANKWQSPLQQQPFHKSKQGGRRAGGSVLPVPGPLPLAPLPALLSPSAVLIWPWAVDKNEEERKPPFDFSTFVFL